MGIDEHVGEMLHEFARLERKLAECDKRNQVFQRRVRELELSRDRWKKEVGNLKFQLSQRVTR